MVVDSILSQLKKKNYDWRSNQKDKQFVLRSIQDRLIRWCECFISVLVKLFLCRTVISSHSPRNSYLSDKFRQRPIYRFIIFTGLLNNMFWIHHRLLSMGCENKTTWYIPSIILCLRKIERNDKTYLETCRKQGTFCKKSTVANSCAVCKFWYRNLVLWQYIM